MDLVVFKMIGGDQSGVHFVESQRLHIGCISADGVSDTNFRFASE